MLRAEASVNDRAIVARVAAAKPDFILSIDNMQVFGKELLATPVRGSVNFHNGLIERYRGVNIPSWAIFNGEAEHGVSWHYMNRSVDTGDVVAARRFMLTGKETALSLTLECIRVGIELFAEHLQSLLAGNRTRVDVAGARVYRHRDLPNDGYLDLRWSSAQIDRMLRATDFRPFPNPFCYARIRFPAGELIVNEAQPMAHTGTPVPGEIVAADDKLVLACGDAALDITAVMLSPEEEATVKNAVAALGLAAGQRAIRAS